jgi:hypothetical protein
MNLWRQPSLQSVLHNGFPHYVSSWSRLRSTGASNDFLDLSGASHGGAILPAAIYNRILRPQTECIRLPGAGYGPQDLVTTSPTCQGQVTAAAYCLLLSTARIAVCHKLNTLESRPGAGYGPQDLVTTSPTCQGQVTAAPSRLLLPTASIAATDCDTIRIHGACYGPH